MGKVIRLTQKYGVKAVFFGSVLYFGYLMILITIQYIPIDFEVAFLPLKQDEIRLTHYQIAFFTHVYTSICILFLGLSQFSHHLLTNYPLLHRSLGKIYIIFVLAVAAPTGIIMGYYANGGPVSQVGFMTMGTLWFLFTAKATQAIYRRKIAAHQNFMLRSYALTLSAISLRLLKLGIVYLWDLPPYSTTQLISWGGWLINLAIAEWVIYGHNNSRSKSRI